jgi:hypothetical protein
MAVDLVIDIENTPGALARVAAAISDAGVNIAAATCIGPGERAELHILVPHAGAAKHSLAISHLAVSREREVVVVDVEDRPGVLADLTRKIARAGVDLDLVYVATRNRVVFGAADLDALKAALGDLSMDLMSVWGLSGPRRKVRSPRLHQRREPDLEERRCKLGLAGRLELFELIEAGSMLRAAAAGAQRRAGHRAPVVAPLAGGLRGERGSRACLSTRRPVPGSCPWALSVEQERAILDARAKTNWGPMQLQFLTGRHRSTI